MSLLLQDAEVSGPGGHSISAGSTIPASGRNTAISGARPGAEYAARHRPGGPGCPAAGHEARSIIPALETPMPFCLRWSRSVRRWPRHGGEYQTSCGAGGDKDVTTVAERLAMRMAG